MTSHLFAIWNDSSGLFNIEFTSLSWKKKKDRLDPDVSYCYPKLFLGLSTSLESIEIYMFIKLSILTYNLLEARRIDNVIIRNIFPPLFKLVEARSVETVFFWRLRYANVSLTHSLTHSGVDTLRN